MGWRKWLPEIPLETRRRSRLACNVLGTERQRDQSQMPALRLLAQRLCDFITAHIEQLEIEQHDAGPKSIAIASAAGPE